MKTSADNFIPTISSFSVTIYLSEQPADRAGDAVPMSMQMPGSYMQLNVATVFNKETAASVRLPYSQPVFPPI